jgi:hypothetical protein
MKKPTLSDALASRAPPPAPPDSAGSPNSAASRPPLKKADSRITTTIRLEPAWLEALKIVAAKKRVKVNDLLLEGAAHVLAVNGHKVISSDG